MKDMALHYGFDASGMALHLSGVKLRPPWPRENADGDRLISRFQWFNITRAQALAHDAVGCLDAPMSPEIGTWGRDIQL